MSDKLVGAIVVAVALALGYWLGFLSRGVSAPQPDQRAAPLSMVMQLDADLAYANENIKNLDRMYTALLNRQCRCPHSTGSTGEIGAK